jgi:uncharacterized protein GlcG (DUF336 family)
MIFAGGLPLKSSGAVIGAVGGSGGTGESGSADRRGGRRRRLT